MSTQIKSGRKLPFIYVRDFCSGRDVSCSRVLRKLPFLVKARTCGAAPARAPEIGHAADAEPDARSTGCVVFSAFADSEIMGPQFDYCLRATSKWL